MAEKTISAEIQPNDSPHRVAILALDGVVAADLATPVEVFGRARSRLGTQLYEVRVCGLTRSVRSSHFDLQVPWRLASLRRAGTVVVPGLSNLNAVPAESVLRALRQSAAAGARVVSVCTGAFVVAAAGLFDGRHATTHWMAAAELARRYPAVEVDPDVLFVDEGDVLSSAGASAALDLCLHIVNLDYGADIAAEVARASVMPLQRSGGQAQFILHKEATDGTSINGLLAWMQSNLEGDLSLRRVASKAGMSTRSLSRSFRAQTGTTPAQWVIQARVRRAQVLLEKSELSVEQVAERSGFGSASVLRGHFAQLVHTSPLQYRRSFRPSG